MKTIWMIILIVILVLWCFPVRFEPIYGNEKNQWLQEQALRGDK